MIRDAVFVGWCTDAGKKYAEGFKKYIDEHNYDFTVVIGGNDGKGSISLSITETVISQMDSCCGSIFLLPKKIDPETKKEAPISANVSFEYGYLLNRLKYHNITPLIIKLDGLTDAALPTDLKNCWSKDIDSKLEGEARNKDIFKQIATEYVSRKNVSNYTPFEFLTKSNEISELLVKFKERKNIQLILFATYLIYYSQACYYSQDFSTLEKILMDINESDSVDYLNCVKHYLLNSINFYKKFFDNDKTKLSMEDAVGIVRKYKSLNDDIDDIDDDLEIKYLLKYLVHEHIGFASAVAIANNKDYIEESLKNYIIHDANKALYWINEHLKFIGYIKDEETIIDLLDKKKFESTDKEKEKDTRALFFFDVLFASHCYGQLSNLYYRLYEVSDDESDKEKTIKYCAYTVKCRKYIDKHFYSDLKMYNNQAYETIRLDYHSALSREYLFTPDEDEYKKNERRGNILHYLREKEKSQDTYEHFVDNIKKTVGFIEDHTFTIAVCGSSGSGKTTMVNELLSRYKNKECLGVLEEPKYNDFLGKDTFKSQLTFYTQNLDFFSSELEKNHDLVIFDRSIDDHYSLSCYRHEIGELEDEELAVLTYLKDTIKKIVPKVDLMIFLRCSKEEHIIRFKDRHHRWDEEADKYVDSMSLHYEKWLETLKKKKEFQIIEIDNTNGIDEATYKKICYQIDKGIRKKNNKE